MFGFFAGCADASAGSSTAASTAAAVDSESPDTSEGSVSLSFSFRSARRSLSVRCETAARAGRSRGGDGRRSSTNDGGGSVGSLATTWEPNNWT
jgi:hypothetical protein